MAANMASTVFKGCFSPLWAFLSLPLFSRWFTFAPFCHTLLIASAIRAWLCLLPSVLISSCFPSFPFVLPPHPLSHCITFSALFASLPFMVLFLTLLFTFFSPLSLILVRNILKERLITFAWPCLTWGEWFFSGSFWCGLCVIDESCSICFSKLCLWRAWMHLLWISLFFFPETSPNYRTKSYHFPCVHHPHRCLNVHERRTTLHNPPFFSLSVVIPRVFVSEIFTHKGCSLGYI